MAADRVFLAVLILGMILGEATAANFGLCYGACFAQCMIEKKDKFKKKLLPCAWQCFGECTRGTLAADSANAADFYCRGGCAMSMCQNSINGTHSSH